MPLKNFNIFSKYMPDLKDVVHQNIKCIFHDDDKPSLSITLDKGLYHCHACKEGGDIYTLVMKMEGCSFPEAKRKITGHANVSVLSEAEVIDAHNFLIKKKYIQDMLFKHRGWLLETIIKFKLGWNDKEKRVQIPIYNKNNELINIRKYLVVGHVTKKNPKFTGVKGHNENYFFPINNLLKNEFIMLCAGEPDTILACQLGFNAGTFTAGEGSFNRNLLPLFKGKLVYICYDKDVTGLKGRKAISMALLEYAEEVKIIDLPFGG
jgi:DNA primase